MDQRTHSWIAIRAIALLEDEGKEQNLVSLLKPHAAKASAGAWIPDQVDAKRGGAGSGTDNHVLKMELYTGNQKDRFVVDKDALIKNVGTHRMAASLLQKDTSLDPAWWAAPYKGDAPKQGQHLPNRIMALSTMMKDELLMGDRRVDHLIPGDIRFAEYLDDSERTPEEMAAMDFFMLSHFVADASMPCHCDGRKLAGYSAGLHMELEKHWSSIVGTAFEKDRLIKGTATSKQILAQAKALDTKFGLTFDPVSIPDLLPDHDVWLEAIYLCRASFAIASIMAPYKTYPYDDSRPAAPFAEVFGKGKEQILSAVDQAAMHDAVLNTAIVWKHIWNKVSTE